MSDPTTSPTSSAFQEWTLSSEENPGAGDRTDRGRLIRPAIGDGVALEDGIYRLEDIDELAERLRAHAEGKLARLRNTVEAVEARLRTRAEESLEHIRSAYALAEERIQKRIEETAQRSQELLAERHCEGYELGQSEGFRDGFEQGLEKGLKEGRARGENAARAEWMRRFQEESRAALAQLETLAKEFADKRHDLLGAARQDIVRLAVAAASRVVDHEIAAHPESIEDSVTRALDRVTDHHRLTIEIHPRDRVRIEELLSRPVFSALAGDGLIIQEREDITRGGCRVKSPTCCVDLTLETRFEVLERTLLEAGGEA